MLRHRFSEVNFIFLLAGLGFFLVLIPVLRLSLDPNDDEVAMRQCVSLGFLVMLLIGVWALRPERRTFQFGLLLTFLQFLLWVASEITDWHWLELSARLVVLLFYLLTAHIAIRHVFNFQRVDVNLLIGAVCVYLLIGLIFAIFFYFFVQFWPDAAFAGLDLTANRPSFDDFLYYSFTTLTTTGYGDITPINPLLRTLAYFEMIIGQFYVAILVAGLVSFFMMSRGNHS